MVIPVEHKLSWAEPRGYIIAEGGCRVRGEHDRRQQSPAAAMDRYGIQSIALLTLLTAFSAVYLLNGGGSEDPPSLDLSSKGSAAPVVRSHRSSSSSSSSPQEQVRLGAIPSGELMRRQLLQSSSDGSYIGYGALTGDNVPCPPQSGRSYYTPNCQSATGPVNPYTRGCSSITRCARG